MNSGKILRGAGLGMLETVGMVPAIEACDKMLKAAEVELISYENVGSTLVTMFLSRATWQR